MFPDKSSGSSSGAPLCPRKLGSMVRILVIQHEDSVGIDKFGRWLEEAGAELVMLRPDRGDAIPENLA